ncbi:MAG TPA: hypothetical protein DEO83_07155 [Lachnospiraceae bacterium]|nr:hypothetical protein [Lachnospiraceae bacterium]
MPRAEKSTKELKKDLDKIREKYERAVEKDNRRIADIVRKHMGEEPDLELLDEYLGKMTAVSSQDTSSGRKSSAGKVQDVSKKDDTSSEHYVPSDGTSAIDE